MDGHPEERGIRMDKVIKDTFIVRNSFGDERKVVVIQKQKMIYGFENNKHIVPDGPLIPFFEFEEEIDTKDGIIFTDRFNKEWKKV